MPEHCIVTPVLNGAETIDRAIWSIVSQSGDIDIRYHVQDGGSTDGTLEKLKSWAKKLGMSSELLPGKVRFTFRSEPDSGMYDAINKGFAGMQIASDGFMSWC